MEEQETKTGKVYILDNKDDYLDNDYGNEEAVDDEYEEDALTSEQTEDINNLNDIGRQKAIFSI
jgi:hypothetical protein